MKRWLTILGFVAVVLVVGTQVAEACPMCAEALASGKADRSQDAPLGFYYSILFMLSMPFILTGAFGFAFYRLHRQRLLLESHAPAVTSAQPV